MKTYTLQYPVTWDNQEIKTIDFRRPKGKDIKRIGANAGLNDIMGVAVNVTDYTPKFFDELDAADYIAVSEVIGDFLVDGRTPG